MTDASFVEEIRALKADLGPGIPMRVRAGHPDDDHLAHGALALLAVLGRSFSLLNEMNDMNPFLCLYPANAAPGALPQVIVDVPNSPDVYAIEPGRLVEVHGVAQPGHAVVVSVDGHLYWPAYPARTKARAPRL